MSKTSGSEKKWLVKSSGKILGPFTFDEITADLMSRKISMIDEVRSPDERWLFIRENSHFAMVVKVLGESQGPDETTSISDGRTVTTDLTPPPVSQPLPPASAKMAEVLESNPPPIELSPGPIYTTSRDPRVQKKAAPERRRVALIGWLILLVVILCLVALRQMPHRENSRSLSFNDLISLARRSKSLGKYEKSLEFYRKAEVLQPLDVPQLLQMVPLLMVVENQNGQARQILEGLASPSLDAKVKTDIDSLLALSYLREGRVDEAQRRYQELSQNSPQHEPAFLNLVEISIIQGEFDAALEKINALMKAGMKEPVLFLYRILAIFRTTDSPQKLDSAKADLKRLIGQFNDHRSEMLLIMAALQNKMNEALNMNDTIRSLLDTDPDLTNQHLHDLLVHRFILGWEYLGHICDLLVKSAPESAPLHGLGVYCSYEQGHLKGAMEEIEKARAQDGKDPSLIALHAFLLMKSGRTSEAKALLQLPQARETNLGEAVKATICESQGDWSCAEEVWRRVLQKDSRHLGAFAGLARVSVARGQQEMALDFMKQGLLISSQYVPLLELKERINEK